MKGIHGQSGESAHLSAGSHAAVEEIFWALTSLLCCVPAPSIWRAYLRRRPLRNKPEATFRRY